MTKKAPKAEASPLPAITLPSETPVISSPTLVISESTANEFIKEVSGVSGDSLSVKQNAFVDKFLGDVVKPKPPPKPKAVKSLPTIPPVPSIVAPVAKVEDATTQKATLIAKITMNVTTFEPLLKDFVKPDRETYLAALPKRSVSDLEIALKTLEHTRAVGNMTNQLKHLVYIAASAVEVASRRFGLRSEGYAQALRAQETEIKMCLQEIAMERAEDFSKMQRPELRLALLLSTTLIGLDNANRLDDLKKQSEAEAVPPLVAKQYEDL